MLWTRWRRWPYARSNSMLAEGGKKIVTNSRQLQERISGGSYQPRLKQVQPSRRETYRMQWTLLETQKNIRESRGEVKLYWGSARVWPQHDSHAVEGSGAYIVGITTRFWDFFFSQFDSKCCVKNRVSARSIGMSHWQFASQMEYPLSRNFSSNSKMLFPLPRQEVKHLLPSSKDSAMHTLELTLLSRLRLQPSARRRELSASIHSTKVSCEALILYPLEVTCSLSDERERGPPDCESMEERLEL